MFKIGILGSENIHALRFSQICNIPDEKGKFRYDDIRVVAIYGHTDDPKHTQQVAQQGRIEHILSTPDEMINMVDAVMLVNRDGKFNLEQALPFIEKGVPVWIDKPICTTLDDALNLRKAVKHNGIIFAGGSALKYSKQVLEIKNEIAAGSLGHISGGTINYPADLNSEYSGIFFYGPHLCMILTEIFGYDLQSISAMSAGKDVTAAIARYNDKLVTLNFNNLTKDSFVTVYGKKKSISAQIFLDNIFTAEMDDFIEAIKENRQPLKLSDMLTGTYILNAINKSLAEKKEVAIPVDGFSLGVISDEVSQDIEVAAAFAEKHGIKGLELRTVFGKGPHQLNDNEISQIKIAMEKHGLVCCGISSPFYKCSIDSKDELNEHIKVLESCINLAKKLETTNIRGFAFWKQDNLSDYLENIKEKFVLPAKMLEDANMVLLLENEPTTFASNGYTLAKVLKAINHNNIKAVWDPGNDIYDTEGEIPFPNGYDAVKDYMHHMHIKDAIKLKDGKVEGVVFGEGMVDFTAQFKQMAVDGYKGWCVLETHYRPSLELSEEDLKKPGGYAFSVGGEQASEECMININSLFQDLGLEIK